MIYVNLTVPFRSPVFHGFSADFSPVHFWVLQCSYFSRETNLVCQGSMGYYLAAGACYGLGLSLYGNFGKDIPVDLFQFPDTAIQYIVIPIAMVLYALVWRYIVGNLNRIFAIE